ncbi:MAG TPA: O-methyltransferase [Aestuariivirgaceae bacterium]|jgi:predicted O-methyltransferase YrrM
MPEETWTEIDQYLTRTLVRPEDALEHALQASEAAGLPAIHVSPGQGKLLMLLARIQDAQRVLEIGTLAGYSTIWLARGLGKHGRIITLEADPKHAKIARDNFAKAGLTDIIDLRLGKALHTLPQLVAAGEKPFDLIFIDADKQHIPEYFSWALKLSRPGTIIVVDNVVRSGAVIETDKMEPNIAGVRRFLEMAGNDQRVSGTALQTVGSKGHDGFALLRVQG